MKYWFVVLGLALLCGCSARVYGDASVLKQYDRRSDSWSVNTQDGKQTEVQK